MLTDKRMLTAMATKAQAKQAIRRLRKGVDPKFKDDIDVLADSLDELVESAAASLGRQGGTARAKKLSKGRRAEIARAGAKARWGNKNGSKKSK